MGKILNIIPVSDLRQDAAKVLKRLRDSKSFRNYAKGTSCCCIAQCRSI